MIGTCFFVFSLLLSIVVGRMLYGVWKKEITETGSIRAAIFNAGGLILAVIVVVGIWSVLHNHIMGLLASTAGTSPLWAGVLMGFVLIAIALFAEWYFLLRQGAALCGQPPLVRGAVTVALGFAAITGALYAMGLDMDQAMWVAAHAILAGLIGLGTWKVVSQWTAYRDNLGVVATYIVDVLATSVLVGMWGWSSFSEMRGSLLFLTPLLGFHAMAFWFGYGLGKGVRVAKAVFWLWTLCLVAAYGWIFFGQASHMLNRYEMLSARTQTRLEIEINDLESYQAMEGYRTLLKEVNRAVKAKDLPALQKAREQAKQYEVKLRAVKRPKMAMPEWVETPFRFAKNGVVWVGKKVHAISAPQTFNTLTLTRLDERQTTEILRKGGKYKISVAQGDVLLEVPHGLTRLEVGDHVLTYKADDVIAFMGAGNWRSEVTVIRAE
ncbi:MAG: hypothetical protein PHT51_00925 [Patescibacteria group bacterium]|nr:hypothetical protein [Patescibacteria group bacterium]MDD4610577.1 hypothetical protein [Patescibacteria group bacterium]